MEFKVSKAAPTRASGHRRGLSLIRVWWALAVAGALLLSACGSPSAGAVDPGGSEGYILTIKTDGRDQAEVARTYDGEILSWDDQSGIALLKVQSLNSAAIAAQNTTVPATSNSRMTSPAVQSSGWNAWSGGWNAWSGGWNAWSGGWNAWSGGNTLPANPAENNVAFMQIRLPQAHAVSRNFGAGVKVAVIDTGIDTAHPGFTGRLAPQWEWRDYVDSDNVPNEASGSAYGHGTAVAGLILQVAPRATILPLRVLEGNGGGQLSNVIMAIDHAINVGAKVVNVSLGSEEAYDPLFTVLDRARRAGVYIFASAGNFGAKDRITFPGRMVGWKENGYLWRDTTNYVFGVGSVNANNALSSFSSRGQELQFVAPGESLTTFAPGSQTFRVSGTSFAAPLVSGAVALAMSETSSANWPLIGSTLLRNDVGMDQRMMWWQHYRASRSWCDVGNAPNQWCHGWGRLDVEAMIRALPGWTQPTPRIGMDFVINGNFDTGSSNWSLSNGVVAQEGNNGQSAFSGDFSARVNSGGSLSQNVTGLQPNTTYTITAWAQVNWSGESGVMGVRNHGQAERSQTIANTSGKGEWVRQSMSFTTGSTSTSAQIFFSKSSGAGPLFVDRISVTQGSTVY